MIRTLSAGALLCALTIHAGGEAASAPPKTSKNLNKIKGDTAAQRHLSTTHLDTARPIPPGLQLVLAEGAGRVVVLTCADVRAAVDIVGKEQAEAAARAAGATDKQIERAKKCLR